MVLRGAPGEFQETFPFLYSHPQAPPAPPAFLPWFTHRREESFTFSVPGGGVGSCKECYQCWDWARVQTLSVPEVPELKLKLSPRRQSLPRRFVLGSPGRQRPQQRGWCKPFQAGHTGADPRKTAMPSQMTGLLWVGGRPGALWVLEEAESGRPIFSHAPQGEWLFRQLAVNKWGKCLPDDALAYTLLR